MKKRTTAFRIRTCHRQWICCLLLVGLVCGMMGGCQASPDSDRSFFENQLQAQAPAAGDTARLIDLNWAQVTDIMYSDGILASNSFRLESDEDKAVLKGLLVHVDFTRLTDRSVSADDPAVREKTGSVLEKGLIFTYYVRTRNTVGSIYISPEGQACWFTSDDSGIYLSQPGSVDYITARRLGLRLAFGDALDGYTPATGSGEAP